MPKVLYAMGGHCINLFSGSGPPYANLTEHVLFVNDYVHACNLSAIKSSQSFEVEVRHSEIADNVAAGNPLIDFAGAHAMRVIGCDVHDSVSIGVQTKFAATTVPRRRPPLVELGFRRSRSKEYAAKEHPSMWLDLFGPDAPRWLSGAPSPSTIPAVRDGGPSGG